MHARSSELPLEIDSIDEAAVAWANVAEATYLLHQRFRYDYPAPIADLHHRLTIVPRAKHGDQRRIAARLDISPRAVTEESLDEFGNPVTTVFARRVERSIEFAHWSVVSRTRVPEHRVETAVANDTALREPTRLTAADAELRSIARMLRSANSSDASLAQAINDFVFAEMFYRFGVTDVETTAARAFELRHGVCQDHAHVMLALARRCGLAARYVSGHLIGEGGTHAWVEVLVEDGPSALVLGLDPTHGCRTDMRYLVVAVGRDYADVAPTSGVFTAPFPGEMTASKRVGATRIRYVA
jgi:transglutaminase-like putative cysteine protease